MIGSGAKGGPLCLQNLLPVLGFLTTLGVC
jgi:hypothetical protein